ncbi:uncharacterized protein VTP21DRAFT_10570 [Calcarisporiella thermophila]|uniref:uncharacterized protein n=1 Tax=Calcarisporiella thermophila TaxID=911321 RepID=UPI0037427970
MPPSPALYRSTSLDLAEFPTHDLIYILADYLTRITRSNDQRNQNSGSGRGSTGSSEWLHPAYTRFHARSVPAIDIHSYLARILKYCPCPNECFLSLLVYFDRMMKICPFNLSSYNVHRLIISGIVVSSKFFSDVFYTNSRYAKVGGLPVSELNTLEIEFLLLCEFQLAITIDELQERGDQLLHFMRQAEEDRRIRSGSLNSTQYSSDDSSHNSENSQHGHGSQGGGRRLSYIDPVASKEPKRSRRNTVDTNVSEEHQGDSESASVLESSPCEQSCRSHPPPPIFTTISNNSFIRSFPTAPPLVHEPKHISPSKNRTSLFFPVRTSTALASTSSANATATTDSNKGPRRRFSVPFLGHFWPTASNAVVSLAHAAVTPGNNNSAASSKEARPHAFGGHEDRAVFADGASMR